jgi:hypothetical protein
MVAITEDMQRIAEEQRMLMANQALATEGATVAIHLPEHPTARNRSEEHLLLRTTRHVAEGKEVNPDDLLVTDVGYMQGDAWRSMTNGNDIRQIGDAYFDKALLEDVLFKNRKGDNNLLWSELQQHDTHRDIFLDAMTGFSWYAFEEMVPELRAVDGIASDYQINRSKRAMAVQYEGSGLRMSDEPNFLRYFALLDSGPGWENEPHIKRQLRGRERE